MKLNFPAGIQQYEDISGNTYVADSNGQLEIGAANPGPFLSEGFSAVADPVGPRPTTNTYPGMMLFDTVLAAGAGKPIWRNASNTGWVDATGASV